MPKDTHGDKQTAKQTLTDAKPQSTPATGLKGAPYEDAQVAKTRPTFARTTKVENFALRVAEARRVLANHSAGQQARAIHQTADTTGNQGDVSHDAHQSPTPASSANLSPGVSEGLGYLPTVQENHGVNSQGDGQISGFELWGPGARRAPAAKHGSKVR